ncbi:MAG: GntR family transcriptional regulator [Treponema sp.]
MGKNCTPGKTSKEVFIDYMEQLLLMHFFLPGERLPSERELASRMGVSRPVIHDSLLELSARGLITIRPRHGWIVNNFTKEGSLSLLNSLYRFSSVKTAGQIDAGLEDLRRIILTESLKHYFSLPCGIDTEGDALPEALTHLNDKSKKIVNIKQRSAADIQKAAEYDFLFYRRIIEAGGNIVFILLFNSSRDLYYEKIGGFFVRHPHSLSKAAELKDQFIAAVRSHAAAEAEQLLESMTSYSAYMT